MNYSKCSRLVRASAAKEFVLSKRHCWSFTSISFIHIPCEYCGEDVIALEFDCHLFASFMFKKLLRYRPASWSVRKDGHVVINF